MYFYFVLFFIVNCLNFCCEFCEDYCCDCLNDCWEDCCKKDIIIQEEEKKEEEKREEENKEEEKREEELEDEKKDLKNQIRKYLKRIGKELYNITNNIEKGINNTSEEIFNKIARINELKSFFETDDYFHQKSILEINQDLNEFKEICKEADFISFDEFCEEDENWEDFLRKNNIQEEYEKEQNITQENFSLENTLEKLKNNFGTYLLEIFKTRLFPVDTNGEKYKKDFMKFYSDYQIDVFKNTLIIEDSLLNFYRQILQKVKLDDADDDGNKNDALDFYKNALWAENYLYLGYALLTDGDEKKISDKINEKIECNIYTDSDRKKIIINSLINSFKCNITEAIKDSVNENLKIDKDLKKNKSEDIKGIAFYNYNEAIKNLNGEKIKLTFLTRYMKNIGDYFFLKKAKLSVLFDYVLSEGRGFYAIDDGNEVDEKTPYLTYEKEKERIELKTAANLGDSLNGAINNDKNITIEEFYEKNSPKVFIFFKSDN